MSDSRFCYPATRYYYSFPPRCFLFFLDYNVVIIIFLIVVTNESPYAPLVCSNPTVSEGMTSAVPTHLRTKTSPEAMSLQRFLQLPNDMLYLAATEAYHDRPALLSGFGDIITELSADQLSSLHPNTTYAIAKAVHFGSPRALIQLAPTLRPYGP